MSRFLIILILVLIPFATNGDTYNRGENVPIYLNLSPGSALAGATTPSYIIVDGNQDTITSGDLSVVASTSNLIYYGEYSISAAQDDGTYAVILTYEIDGGDTWIESETFEINVFQVSVESAVDNYGYITHADCGGVVQLTGGTFAHGANIKVYPTGSTAMFRIFKNAVKADGTFEIWVPTDTVFDIEIDFQNYNFNKCTGVTATAP